MKNIESQNLIKEVTLKKSRNNQNMKQMKWKLTKKYRNCHKKRCV